MSPPFDWWPPDGPWPATPGGLRGPDGRTLTSLYNALVGGVTPEISLLARLDSIAQKLDRTNLILQVALGDPDNPPMGWNGLAAYLDLIMASARSAPPLTMIDLLEAIRAATVNVGASVDAAAMSEAGRDVTEQVYLEEIQFNTAGAAASSAAMSAVLGDFFGTPVNVSIKQLLADSLAEQTRAADCCEESNQEPSPVNDPPTENLCDGDYAAQLVRVVGLIPVQQGSTGSAPGETRIGLDFGPGDGGFLTYDGIASAEAGLPVYATSEFGDVPVCVQWNLLGDKAPPWDVQRVLVEQVGGVWEPTVTVSLGTAFASPPGSGTNTVAADRRIAFRLSVLGDENSPPPGPNFWLSYGEVS